MHAQMCSQPVCLVTFKWWLFRHDQLEDFHQGFPVTLSDELLVPAFL